MPGRHRKPGRNPAPALTAAGAAAALIVPGVLAASTGASAATSHEVATARLAQPYWWHRHHVIHQAREAQGAPAHTASGKVWGVTYGYPYKCGDGDGDGWDIPCSQLHHHAAPAPAPRPVALARHAPAATYSGSGGYQSCVISRESGGDPHAVNASSGAGGLYQFLPSTWAGLGYSGLPQDAPVSVQNQAFAKLYAQAGTSPWSPSDGCP